jgi:hypothetical protein
LQAVFGRMPVPDDPPADAQNHGAVAEARTAGTRGAACPVGNKPGL